MGVNHDTGLITDGGPYLSAADLIYIRDAVLKTAALTASDYTDDAMAFTADAAGAVLRKLIDKAHELKTLGDFGGTPSTTGQVDITNELRLLATTGLSATLVQGDYQLSGQIDWPALGQLIRGEGRDKTRIFVNELPPDGTAALFNCLDGDQAACFEDIGFYFAQPDTMQVGGLGGLRQYPPAILYTDATRARLSRIKIQGGWDGIRFEGNSGGAVVTDYEASCLGTNLYVDGAKDTMRFSDVHIWPFGLTPDMQSVFYDTSVGIHVKRCDGFHVVNPLLFIGRGMVFEADSEGNDAFGSVLGGGFDTFGGLEMSAGDISFTGTYFTVGNAGKRAITLSGGSMSLTGGWMYANVLPASGMMISQTGGELSIEGTNVNRKDSDFELFNAEGTDGMFSFDSVTVLCNPATDYNNTLFYFGGGTGGEVTNCTVTGPTAGGGGTFMTFTADLPVLVADNSHPGRIVDMAADYLKPVFMNNYSAGARDFIGNIFSGPRRMRRLIGVADSSGSYTVSHGIPSGDQRILGAVGFYKSAVGVARQMTCTYVDANSVVFTGASAYAPVRLVLEYSDEPHTW